MSILISVLAALGADLPLILQIIQTIEHAIPSSHPGCASAAVKAAIATK